MRFFPRLALLVLLVAMAGCATRPDPTDRDAVAEYNLNNDPLEPANRVSFAVSEAVDQAVIEPAARAYRSVVPEMARLGIRNVLVNLRSPVILLNDLLQGEGERARITLGRFMVNSTLGLGGILDLSRDWGVPGHYEDFGQTLAVWGLGEGPYLYIPILGPSSPRDLAGTLVDFAADPVTYLGQGAVVDALGLTRTGLTVLDTREWLLDAVEGVRAASLDPYSAYRAAWRQRRAAAISNEESRAGERSGTGLGRSLGLPGLR